MCIRISLVVSCAVVLFSVTSHAATLVHHYTFDSAVTDSAGSANGSLFNGATVTDGKLVLSAASSQYVEFGVDLVPNSGPFTVAFYAQETSHVDGFVEMISQGDFGSAFYLGYQPGNGIRGGDQWPSTGASFPLDGLVHHYAYVRSATDTQLYIDGTLVGSRGTPTGTIISSTPTRLGRQFGGFSEFFSGNMDDVRVYDGALSEAEIDGLITVPEPTAAAMFACLGAIALVRRRR